MSGKKTAVKGSTLKWIAIITMLIDHTGATLVEGILMSYGQESAEFQRWRILYIGMRMVGRLAFPIFCYLLIEGIRHTSNAGKYGLRLLLFAFLSELPFDYAFNGGWMVWNGQNVFFTLFLGFSAVKCIQWIEKRNIVDVVRQMLILIPTACFMAAAELLSTDYGAWGVLTIVLLYCIPRLVPQKHKEIGFILAMIPLTVTNIWELPVFLDALPIHSYDGTRGKQMKYFFYLFYPAHLLILGVLYHLIFT